MDKKNIVHLATDEKFIDMAFSSFEKVLPNSNQIVLYGKSPLKHVTVESCKLIGPLDAVVGSLAKEINHADLIVVHSLSEIWMTTILRLDKKIPILWLGWGYDYYHFIDKRSNAFLLEKTAETQINIEKKRFILKETIKSKIKNLLEIPTINRIDFFAPVLPIEYDKVKKNIDVVSFPLEMSWNYGNLEDNYAKDMDDLEVTGNNILLGNSATYHNNHKEALDVIVKCSGSDQLVLAPLSYGPTDYAQEVKKYGSSLLGARFKSMDKFMPIDEYLKTIRSCGFVVMNHLRQQAVANIVSMLYFGAKVFLNENNPVYEYLKEAGVVVYSTTYLVEDPSSITTRLPLEDIKNNRRIISSIWSKENSHLRTKSLIENILDKHDI
ncbi:hypothetical protein BCU69_19170 [Vibrio cyclitrophicus]|uniref:TDP-N-acetylfucosamine:lipid II N-acetylfucosaminyltransferase n=1 Tax=Vibrio cyclitrophicus TaxID=47951 RepID=UPI000CBCC265|nr:TDP-N-acetylfucosamine:lipid II N-acetylfucosaminyltransferase [Vibrio cyclitrophicus]PMH39146.1 hypothetical protein BCU69_19170 [Vibrio cyclitrophicus]